MIRLDGATTSGGHGIGSSTSSNGHYSNTMSIINTFSIIASGLKKPMKVDARLEYIATELSGEMFSVDDLNLYNIPYKSAVSDIDNFILITLNSEKRHLFYSDVVRDGITRCIFISEDLLPDREEDFTLMMVTMSELFEIFTGLNVHGESKIADRIHHLANLYFVAAFLDKIYGLSKDIIKLYKDFINKYIENEPNTVCHDSEDEDPDILYDVLIDAHIYSDHQDIVMSELFDQMHILEEII